MKLPETSEWVLHTVTVIAQLPAGTTVSGAQLAEHFGVPGPYLSKQLAKLVRAGVLTGSTGPRGGFRLAKEPERISILDLVVAVDAPPIPTSAGRSASRGEEPPARRTAPARARSPRSCGGLTKPGVRLSPESPSRRSSPVFRPGYRRRTGGCCWNRPAEHRRSPASKLRRRSSG